MSKIDTILGRDFWWIKTTDPRTAKFKVVGPFMSDYMAQVEADKLGVPAEVVSIATRNPQRALSWLMAQRDDK